jgi:predicted aspartyl protease
MMDVQELSEGITAECYSKTAARFIVRSMKKNHVKVPSEDAIMVFAIEFLTKIMDENDPMHVEFFSEISLECATRASRVQVEGPASARVSLSRFDEMFKIKITLGKSSKYYLMDTGASNCFISMSYAQELFEEGIISGENVLEPGLYEMANGDIARCNRVLVHRVKVGPYILDNVIFSVIDEEIGFICGKNILDAFQSWKIYNNPPALELSR